MRVTAELRMVLEMSKIMKLPKTQDNLTSSHAIWNETMVDIVKTDAFVNQAGEDCCLKRPRNTFSFHQNYQDIFLLDFFCTVDLTGIIFSGHMTFQ